VVAVSRHSEENSLDLEELPPPVCNFCGFEIEEREQDCPALDDGRCRP
jgi:predicted Zn-ribbon and HTH transcriptional regulator